MCDKDYYTTLALVIFGIGGLIGNYIFGFLQDYWGRRPSFFVYLLLEIVACALSSLAWNFNSWLVFRFVVGLTVPAILASPYVLGNFIISTKNISNDSIKSFSYISHRIGWPGASSPMYDCT